MRIRILLIVKGMGMGIFDHMSLEPPQPSPAGQLVSYLRLAFHKRKQEKFEQRYKKYKKYENYVRSRVADPDYLMRIRILIIVKVVEILDHMSVEPQSSF